jgi:prevent-host-death family protein
MERRSFADVKAHLSEVVDHAEHRGKKILILRHGKPAAAIVPVTSVHDRRARASGALGQAEAQQRIDELVAELGGDSAFSAVTDLLEGRR